MKKTGLFVILCLAAAAYAQQATPSQNQNTPAGTVATNVNFPVEQLATPTYADLYCAGFVNQHPLPDVDFVAGLDTPNTTHFGTGELIFLNGKGYQAGQHYAIVRELHDPNRYESFDGQFGMLKAMGQPYDELGIVQIVDVRSKMDCPCRLQLCSDSAGRCGRPIRGEGQNSLPPADAVRSLRASFEQGWRTHCDGPRLRL